MMIWGMHHHPFEGRYIVLFVVLKMLLQKDVRFGLYCPYCPSTHTFLFIAEKLACFFDFSNPMPFSDLSIQISNYVTPFLKSLTFSSKERFISLILNTFPLLIVLL